MTTEDTQPVKRTPSRPRKAVPAEHHPKHAAADSEPQDPRIGQPCDPPNCTRIAYDDGTEYRCEDGKIVERVR